MADLRARACGALAALALAASGSAYGESAGSAPRPGDRIRVEAPPLFNGKITGSLLYLDAESLTMVVDKSDRKVEIRRDAISRLDTQVGRRRNTLKGALVGALTGAALMALYFSGSNDLSQNSGTGDVVGGFVFFLLPPTAVGAVVGTAIHSDRWVAVTPGPGQAGRRIGVSVAIKF